SIEAGTERQRNRTTQHFLHVNPFPDGRRADPPDWCNKVAAAGYLPIHGQPSLYGQGYVTQIEKVSKTKKSGTAWSMQPRFRTDGRSKYATTHFSGRRNRSVGQL